MADGRKVEFKRIARPVISGRSVPVMRSLRNQKDENELTVGQKITAVILDIKKIYPLIFSALIVIPRVETEEIPDIAVSPDKLYYNGRFVLEKSRPELVFYLIHSVYHILMKHHLRGAGKDPGKWNEVCDRYINKCISDAFGVRPGGGPVTVRSEDGAFAEIVIPGDECFDETVDLKTDTPETLYRIPEQEKEQDPSGESGGFGDAGKYGIGGESGNEGDFSNEENGDAEDFRDEGTDTEPGDSDSGAEYAENQQQDRKSPETDGKNSGETVQDRRSAGQDPAREDDQISAKEQTTENPEKTENGTGEDRRNDKIYRLDLIEDEDSRRDSPDARMQRAERIRSKTDMLYRQILDQKYGRGEGRDPVLEAQIHEDLPKVNWRILLQNRLLMLMTDEKSLSSPDRRFVHRGLYLEGPVYEEDEARDIKICIDTSASMNDSDIADALFQIECLLRQFRIKAELVFWDESIQARMPFKDRREFDLAGYQAKGRGGTNPECLFEAFAQSNARGHTAPVPELLIIFTDGYFELRKKAHHRMFRNRTIWILCSEDSEKKENFDPGFGKVVDLNIGSANRQRQRGKG